MTNITILGSGFGALTTVRELRKRGIGAEITLISPRTELHYLPSSIWIPAKLRKAENLKIPLGPFFAKNKVNFVQASVTGLRNKGRTIVTDKGEFENDHLVIATGGRFLKKLPGIENALTICEGLEVGTKIDRRLSDMQGGTIAFGFATNPNEQGAIRGGPMFELLFIIDAHLRKTGRRDAFKLVFFSPAPRPGIRLGEKAVDRILANMKKRGIDTYLGSKLMRFEADKVVTEAAEISADMILFMPGMTGPAWAAETGLPLSPGGMIAADETCAVAGHPNVWVVGDAGSYPGPDWLAKQAHQADLQAVAVAENILSVLDDKPATRRFKPELICIVDTLDTGIVVYRSERHSIVTPASKLFHWLKRAFEHHYLGAYR
ncbi:MAG: FAD-dependent oxidoreductase [Alphaproteobacteria bacterium]|nr:FAD-dependent oxidoreductase [Alphaproteobacteria bacterium]